jgi:hypothetical protein
MQKKEVKTDFNYFQNDAFRASMLSFYHDFTNSELAYYLGVDAENYVFDDKDSLLVFFRGELDFSPVEKARIGKWMESYLDKVKKPDIAKFITSYTVKGNKIEIRLKKGEMYGGGGLIAPNGKPSNLTPEQWHLVRTPEFKKFFGDWENDPENASKVVDENGEPKVMWHGSEYMDKIYVFKSSKGVDYSFFSEDRSESSRYITDFGRAFPNEKHNKSLRDKYYSEKIKPFYIKALRVFDYKKLSQYEKEKVEIFLQENKSKLIDVIRKYAEDAGMKLSSYLLENDIDEAKLDIDTLKSFLERSSDDWWIIETDVFQDFIKGNKYDSFITSESGYWNIAIYNPSDIKLADGSNTTFDSNNPDIRFDEGGVLPNTIVYNGYKIKEIEESILKYYNGDKIVDVGYSDYNDYLVNRGVLSKKNVKRKAYIFDITEKLQINQPCTIKEIKSKIDEYISAKNPKLKEAYAWIENAKLNKGGSVLLAHNGKPSNLTPEQYRLVRTPEFKAWFGDWENDPENASKVVDENGEPLVCYHGTKKIFTSFKEGKYLGTDADALNWFTTNIKTSIKDYDGWISYPCFIKIVNPLKELTRTPEGSIMEENKKGLQTDGFIFSSNNVVQKPRTDVETWIAIPKSNQIKLAKKPIVRINNKKFTEKYNKTFIDTNTTFDRNSPDIRYGNGGSVSKYKNYEIQIEEHPSLSQVHATITQNGNQIGSIYLDDFPNNPYVAYSGIDKEHSGKGLGSYVYDLLDDYSFNKIGKHITHGDINSSMSAIRIWRKRLKDTNYLPDGFYDYWGDDAGEVLKDLNNPDIRYEGGGRIDDKVGKEFWFEYHCYESKDSCDAEIWYRSHQKVKILSVSAWSFDELQDRIGDGQPRVYSVQFKDGFIADVLEDELMESREGFYRPDPPKINPDIRYAGGGLAKTQAAPSERIYGSKTNKPKSAESTRKGSSIILNPKTISSIKSIIEKHNTSHPSRKIPLATAKAVVRRGMGAYSSIHRPTISGGKPNSRVAWGLARLNAFVYKIQNGKSKSGKYRQDDDLISEIGYKVKSYDGGGQTGYSHFIVTKKDRPVFRGKINKLHTGSTSFRDALDRLFDLGYIVKAVELKEYMAFDTSDIVADDLLGFMKHWDYFKTGGSVRSSSGLTEEQKEDYEKWKDLVNMTPSELRKFMDSDEGREAGLKKKEANRLGIGYGRESARWILKMKETPVRQWTPKMWQWCGRQISFVSRMRGNKGSLYDEKGRKTPKHTSLLIWGHNPEKYKDGGCPCQNTYGHGGCACGTMSIAEIEQALGRKLRWDEKLVAVRGVIYEKVFLRPEYKVIS